jgi:acetyl-CoA acetyltransferase
MARMSPTYATDLALGGATPIAMVQNAITAIEAGMAKTVMCVHARKRATPDPSPGNPIRHGDEHWEELGAISRRLPITPFPHNAICTTSAPPAKILPMSR